MDCKDHRQKPDTVIGWHTQFKTPALGGANVLCSYFTCFRFVDNPCQRATIKRSRITQTPLHYVSGMANVYSQRTFWSSHILQENTSSFPAHTLSLTLRSSPPPHPANTPIPISYARKMSTRYPKRRQITQSKTDSTPKYQCVNGGWLKTVMRISYQNQRTSLYNRETRILTIVRCYNKEGTNLIFDKCYIEKKKNPQKNPKS